MNSPKKSFVVLGIILSTTSFAQTWNSNYLQSLTEGVNTGYRLADVDLTKYGNIGSRAVDLSYSTSGSDFGATGFCALAAGYKTKASQYTSTALGESTTATGQASLAAGRNSTASGYASSAFGSSTNASGGQSLAAGITANASGNTSIALGSWVTASGDRSLALGYSTTAAEFASTVVGAYNLASSTVGANGSASSWDTDNALFVVGNGTSSNASDALVVYANGNATLAGDLTINSDLRLKENVVSLGETSSALRRLDGKRYSFRRDPSHDVKIGLIAQEVQSVYPELVSEDELGSLSVNYQGFIAVLVNAINEQALRIEALEADKKENEAVKLRLAELERRLVELAASGNIAKSAVK